MKQIMRMKFTSSGCPQNRVITLPPASGSFAAANSSIQNFNFSVKFLAQNLEEESPPRVNRPNQHFDFDDFIAQNFEEETILCQPN
ncbi:hypothetical protein V9T40_012703 [Parthenolecanium corni]|uniref:Uncharacterized protein n=1 Tax=Parthenolecanium corni TaxID=536013 RepID=A0AAN9TKV5_9HEMI